MGIFGSARNFSACVNVVETVEAVADAALNKKYLLWVHSIVLLGLLFWLCGVPCVVIIFAGLTSI